MINIEYNFPVNTDVRKFHSNPKIKFLAEDMDILFEITNKDMETLTKEQMFMLGATYARGYCKITNQENEINGTDKNIYR